MIMGFCARMTTREVEIWRGRKKVEGKSVGDGMRGLCLRFS